MRKSGLPAAERLFLSPPHMSGAELEYVLAAFRSNYIAPVGPQIDAFEKAFAEKLVLASAVALSSGTAAMHLALKCLGVQHESFRSADAPCAP